MVDGKPLFLENGGGGGGLFECYVMRSAVIYIQAFVIYTYNLQAFAIYIQALLKCSACGTISVTSPLPARPTQKDICIHNTNKELKTALLSHFTSMAISHQD